MFLRNDNNQSRWVQFNVDLVSGWLTGMVCAGLFNPVDRALYLSVKNNKPFLSRVNFNHPYQGALQAVIQRSFLGGSYFIFQSQANKILSPFGHQGSSWSETRVQACVGLVAGSLSGAFFHPLSVVKYHLWGKEKGAFLLITQELWRAGRLRPFSKGMAASLGRDMVFGVTYEVLRHHLLAKMVHNRQEEAPAHLEFASNLVAASAGTLLSSPFNYARHIQYASCTSARSPNTVSALIALGREASTKGSGLAKLSFFQKRLNVGWGALRVSLGMAVGQQLFKLTQTQLNRVVEKGSIENPPVKSI